jgi:hypothetical protein
MHAATPQQVASVPAILIVTHVQSRHSYKQWARQEQAYSALQSATIQATAQQSLFEVTPRLLKTSAGCAIHSAAEDALAAAITIAQEGAAQQSWKVLAWQPAHRPPTK